jgi:hypothetical protein
MRTRLQAAGLPVPAFVRASMHDDPVQLARTVEFPCVLKPIALSGSRGVMRADDPASFVVAFERLRALLQSPEIRAERDEAHATALVERFIPGRGHLASAPRRPGPNLRQTRSAPDARSSRRRWTSRFVGLVDIQAAIERTVAGAATAIGLITVRKALDRSIERWLIPKRGDRLAVVRRFVAPFGGLELFVSNSSREA